MTNHQPRTRTSFQPRFRTPIPNPVDQLLGPAPSLPAWDLVTDEQTGEQVSREELIRRRTPVWAQDSQGFTAAMRDNFANGFIPAAGGWGPLTGWGAQPNKRGFQQGVFGRGTRSATMGATR